MQHDSEPQSLEADARFQPGGASADSPECEELLKRKLARFQAQQAEAMAMAVRVHRSLLAQPLRHERIWIDVRYLPVEGVGGDYCQARFVQDRFCYITMCDVAGHGIGPALLATRVSSQVLHAVLNNLEPAEIVWTLEDFMLRHFPDLDLFLSFVALRVDLETLELTWCGAGHPSPFLIRHGRTEPELLKSQNGVVGVGLLSAGEVRQSSRHLGTGDRLVLYTDGVFEVFDERGVQLGVAGLARMAQSLAEEPLFAMADQLLERVRDYCGEPNHDDLTLLFAEIH